MKIVSFHSTVVLLYCQTVLDFFGLFTCNSYAVVCCCMTS